MNAGPNSDGRWSPEYYDTRNQSNIHPRQNALEVKYIILRVSD
jgi:hypothetical protein